MTEAMVIIHLGRTSLYASSNLPRSSAGHASASLFGLAPGGVYLATNCYQLRGALLPHHFTLTSLSLKQTEAVSFCCTSRGHYTPQALPGTLPFGARTFLPANNLKDCSHSDYPANFAQNYSIESQLNIYFFLRIILPRAILRILFLDSRGTNLRPLTPSLFFSAFNPS